MTDEKQYGLILNQNNVNVVLTALAELPFKVSADAFLQIRGQVDRQDQQPAVTATTEESPGPAAEPILLQE